MSTSSMKAGISTLSGRLEVSREKVADIIRQLESVEGDLVEFGATFDNLKTEIASFPASGSAVEELSKDEYTKLMAQAAANITKVQTAITALE